MSNIYKILSLVSLAVSLAACEFKSSIPPLELEEAPEQTAFGAIDSELGEEKFPGADLIRRLDEMYDPFYMGQDTPYEGTVYEQMDQILAGAYEYHGYDLAEIAANGEPNPLTDDDVLEYLSATGQQTVVDPETGEEFGVYDWFTIRLITGNTGTYLSVLDEIDETLKNDRMNFERNYLAALYEANPDQKLVARLKFRQRLISDFGEDAEGMFLFLDSLEPALG